MQKRWQACLVLTAAILVSSCASYLKARNDPLVNYPPQPPNHDASLALRVMQAGGYGEELRDVEYKRGEDPNLDAAIDNGSTPINDTLLAAGYFTKFYDASPLSNGAMGGLVLAQAFLKTSNVFRHENKLLAWLPVDQYSSEESALTAFAQQLSTSVRDYLKNQSLTIEKFPDSNRYAIYTSERVVDHDGTILSQRTSEATHIKGLLVPMRGSYGAQYVTKTTHHPTDHSGREYYLLVGHILLARPESAVDEVAGAQQLSFSRHLPEGYYQFLYPNKVPLVVSRSGAHYFLKAREQ